MKKITTFQILKNKNGQFYWIITHPNGNVLAMSSEFYKNKKDCLRGAGSTAKLMVEKLLNYLIT